MLNYRIIDAHCDTLSLMADKKVDLSNTSNHVSIRKLKTGNVGIQFFAVSIDPKYRLSSCLKNGLNIIECYHKMLETHKDTFYPILTYKDALNALKSEKIGCMLTIEGGDILEGELKNLKKLYKTQCKGHGPYMELYK